jgi:hypothetical protein
LGSPPYDAPFDRLRARNAITDSACPLATATAASPTMLAAPPPPEVVRAMNEQFSIPSAWTIASSDTCSMWYDTMPSISCTGKPASAHAATIASQARSSSLRPRFLP